MDANEILEGLKNEIDQTLMFFVKTDLQIYGHITADTLECFEVQKRKFPEVLKEFLTPKN
jgi:hypothetical protein